jgi:hypothetical protein
MITQYAFELLRRTVIGNGKTLEGKEGEQEVEGWTQSKFHPVIYKKVRLAFCIASAG